MKINKPFLAFLLSVLAASIAYAVMVAGHADQYYNVGNMPLYIQFCILLYWFAIINAIAWLTMMGISIGHFLHARFSRH